ncbi:MAG: VOC family protein [Gammaproteobacteria bacterium]
MTHPTGVHHLAIMTADVKSQIAFFADVLGMKLKALYWMHNVEGYFHAFMELNPSCYVAFVFSPAVRDIAAVPGVSHAGNPVKPCAAGVTQHIAFKVDTDDELLAMRDRIRAHGVRVLGPLDHGLCQSIYFGGPEGLVLEVSTSAAAIDAAAWIDPEVVELTGISAAELERFKHPAPYVNDSGQPVAQPAPAADRPAYTGMDAGFAAAFDLPDEIVTRELSENTPPVQAAAAG